MHPKRKKKLILILVLFTGFCVAAGLIGYSLKEQGNYFYSPSDLKAGKAPEGKRIRAGGMVVKGSLKRKPDSLDSQFEITDFKATVPVYYNKILPDLFKEGSGVVGTGIWKNGAFYADEILAKHDENYMPPEVQKTLKNTHNTANTTQGSQN